MVSKFLFFTLLLAACQSGQNAHYEKGLNLQAEGRFEEAITAFTKAHENEPKNVQVLNMLGMANRMRFAQTGANKFRTAEIDNFQKAVELDPDFWLGWKNLATTLYLSGKKKLALPAIKKSLELKPDDPDKEVMQNWINDINSMP